MINFDIMLPFLKASIEVYGFFDSQNTGRDCVNDQGQNVISRESILYDEHSGSGKYEFLE